MSSRELYNEPQLIDSLVKGDEKAFTVIFRKYNSKIYNVALHYLKSSTEAEGVVQDTFLKVWLKRTTMSEVRDFEAFLFVIARNFIFDRIKRKAYEHAFLEQLPKDSTSVYDADHKIVEWQYEQLLKKAVAQLPPRQKELFILAKEKGLSHEAIAQKLGISRLTVKKQMARALQTIRRFLHNYMKIILLPPILLLLSLQSVMLPLITG